MGMSQSSTTTETIRSKGIGKDKDSKEQKKLIYSGGWWERDMNVIG